MALPSAIPAAQLDADGLRREIARWTEFTRHGERVLAEYAARLDALTRDAITAQGRSAAAAAKESFAELQQLTGRTRQETTGMLAVGGLLTEGTGEQPWLTPVSTAVTSGEVPVAKARIIQEYLGAPSDDVTAEDLVLAVEHLTGVAAELTPERLAVEARAVREELDQRFVESEEQRIRDRRSLRFHKRRDGSSSLHAELDQEATVIVEELLGTVHGPRTGGPRFVFEEGKAFQQAIKKDERTDEQLAHDALIAILVLGLQSDRNKLPGRRPEVHIVVTERDLRARTGYGVLQNGTAVSIATVEAAICEGGYAQLLVDGVGKVLDHGRTKRHFTKAQRDALAIEWCGCADPDCDRPMHWTEIHHAAEWDADDGPTDLRNGIPLCKTHHLDVHNRGAKLVYDAEREVWVCIEKDGTRRDWQR